MDAPNIETRDHVKNVYAQAATKKAGLCCPKAMPTTHTAHIPQEAFDHNYGCGTPVLQAGIREGDTVIDLGSGVGIDCFVAAKIVGRSGRVIGLDMTDEMLAQAFRFNSAVSQSLGYDVVEFRKGLMEKLPIETNTADVVVTNCVLNLATDKAKVFQEIFRVLKPGGRLVISDIVSDRDVKPEDQADKQEWAECVTGSMSLGGLLSTIEKTGFIGTHQLAEAGWQQVKGYHFSTVTFEAHKHVADCNAAVSTLAIYLGPYAKVTDDLGNEYTRFKPVAVKDDVGAYLRSATNSASFVVVQGRPAKAKAKAAAPAAAKAAAPAAAKRASPCCDPTDKVKPCCDNNEPKADGSPCCDPTLVQQPPDCPCGPELLAEPSVSVETSASCCDGPSTSKASAGGAKASSGGCCDTGSSSSSSSKSSGGGCAPGACGPGGCG
jgi:SAM-dependent methyltransferase